MEEWGRMRINLLLEEFKIEVLKQQRELLITRWLVLLIVSFALVLMIITTGLEIVRKKNEAYLTRLVGSEKEAKEAVRRIDKLNNELAIFQKRKDIYKLLSSRKVIWHEKLTQLQRILPQEIWIRELSLQRGRDPRKLFLSLRMSLINLTNKNLTAFLGEFINKIKTTDFFTGFKEIVLSNVKHITRKGWEMMEFNLKLEFK